MTFARAPESALHLPVVAISAGMRMKWRPPGTLGVMAEPVESSQAGLEAEEARLARAAATGDGKAFATLYERYAQRAYNL
jgi:hypothetical protein